MDLFGHIILKWNAHLSPCRGGRALENKTGRAPIARPGMVVVLGASSVVGWRLLRALATWSGRPARAISALRTRRTQLIRRQLAVAVFIQRLQSRRSVRDLVGVNHTIVVRVQYFHQRRRRHHAASARTPGAARPAGPALAIGPLAALRRTAGIL